MDLGHQRAADLGRIVLLGLGSEIAQVVGRVVDAAHEGHFAIDHGNLAVGARHAAPPGTTGRAARTASQIGCGLSCFAHEPNAIRETTGINYQAYPDAASLAKVYPALAAVPAELFGVCVVGTSGSGVLVARSMRLASLNSS